MVNFNFMEFLYYRKLIICPLLGILFRLVGISIQVSSKCAHGASCHISVFLQWPHTANSQANKATEDVGKENLLALVWDHCRIDHNPIQWHHMSTMATQLYFRWYLLTSIYGKIKAQYYWPFVKGICQWLVVSLVKAGNAEAFPCHEPCLC